MGNLATDSIAVILFICHPISCEMLSKHKLTKIIPSWASGHFCIVVGSPPDYDYDGRWNFYDTSDNLSFSNSSTKLTFFQCMCLFSGSEEEDELVETFMTCYDTGI